MKNVVLKLDLHHDKAKQKALSAVSGLSGVDSISVDMNDKKMTVTGDIDPVHVVSKLRKFCYAEIVSVVSVKDNEKKEEPEKDEPKKVDEKQANDMAAALKAYQAYTNYPQITAYYHVRAADKDYYYPYYHIGSAEENPNACVIC